ncbi:hypothetical protein SEEH4403_18987 [Salmonella enterica subsp. enterica serovar Heidelberg str. N4403]|nr:hypothetical protein SEEH4403_18987 [Salmonella enterica subsp. enterica serovar Heidelberg str. N4403]
MRNENNYLARQNEFEITRLLLSLRAISRDFFIRIYDTKSELSARVKLSANRLKIGQTVHFAEE